MLTLGVELQVSWSSLYVSSKILSPSSLICILNDNGNASLQYIIWSNKDKRILSVLVCSPKAVCLFTINLTGKAECTWKVSNPSFLFLNNKSKNSKFKLGIHMRTFDSLLADSVHTHRTTCGSVAYDTSSAGQEQQMILAGGVMKRKDKLEESSFHLFPGWCAYHTGTHSQFPHQWQTCLE